MGTSYMFTAEIDENNINPDGVKPIEFTVTTVGGWDDATGSVTFPTTTNP